MLLLKKLYRIQNEMSTEKSKIYRRFLSPGSPVYEKGMQLGGGGGEACVNAETFPPPKVKYPIRLQSRYYSAVDLYSMETTLSSCRIKHSFMPSLE